MSATPLQPASSGTAESATSVSPALYGVREWCDPHGNQGLELLSRRQLRLRVVRVDDLFDTASAQTRETLVDYFAAVGN
jgi:hypothetical protein